MVKHLKLNIKNDQLASALQIKSIRSKKKPEDEAEEQEKEAKKPLKAKPHTSSAKEQAAQAAKEDAAAKKPRARIMASPEEIPAPGASEVKKEWEEPAVKAPSVEVEVKKEPAIVEKMEEPPIEQKPAAIVTAQTKEEPPKPKPVELKEEDKGLLAKPKKIEAVTPAVVEEEAPRKVQGFRDFKPAKKKEDRFDTRDRQGLRVQDDETWRKKRKFSKKPLQEEVVIRPKALKIRLPITLKDLAQEMKLKASQLISKLFMQGVTLTLNDYLDDETTIQLLGHDFDCEITIDTSEEDRLRITGKSIVEEIGATSADQLEYRPPVITFMGHVDHGKTSLIDAIRKSNIAAGEAGAITQHIGAFKTKTASGEITILDTPGHEAFFEMRERGANVTDIVILVVAGDEGMREQTIEALKQAKEAKVPIVVAINKADKPAFDVQKVYRELADNELLPESWGGSTITVNCSALTRQGIPELLEMVHLQAEVLELKANSHTRARGTVLESEMHKGLGAVATVLVQNGTLKMGDAVVLGHTWGRVKTMHDEYGHSLASAGPSTPVKITGLSGLAEAGSDFIIVKTEKEARDLAQDRAEGHKQKLLQLSKKAGTEKLLQLKKESGEKKVLALIIKADVQGSLEALKNSLMKLPMDKVRIEIVNESVGEISESDIELAAASKATILGFHTKMESHAESLVKLKKVTVRMHDIIYHAVDDVRAIMTELLDKLEQQKDTGTALVKATFKSSQHGVIAGCIVTEGTITRNNFMRVVRDKEVIWTGKIASLKRVKEDVKEISKGFECGILLEGFQDFKVDDTLQAYEIIYLKQQL